MYNNSIEQNIINDQLVPPQITTPSTSSIREFNGFDIIAKHLARLEKRIDDIQSTLTDISNKLFPQTVPDSVNLPDDLKLPCQSQEDIAKLEQWLAIPENEAVLKTRLSLVGGKKVQNIVRRILEKLFTNQLAVNYNWTGKNNKNPLKDLRCVKVLCGAVRQNKYTAYAKDDEIRDTITSWFRYTKDRDGGREARRKSEEVKKTQVV